MKESLIRGAEKKYSKTLFEVLNSKMFDEITNDQKVMGYLFKIIDTDAQGELRRIFKHDGIAGGKVIYVRKRAVVDSEDKLGKDSKNLQSAGLDKFSPFKEYEIFAVKDEISSNIGEFEYGLFINNSKNLDNKIVQSCQKIVVNSDLAQMIHLGELHEKFNEKILTKDSLTLKCEK